MVGVDTNAGRSNADIYYRKKVVGVETNVDKKIRNNIYRKKWLGLIPTQGGAGEDADL